MDNKFKTVVLGNSGVGKTSILYRLKHNLFKNITDSTIGCEFMSYDYDNIKLMIWDTAGQENFKAFTPSFCRGALISIIVFDLTDENSFQMIRDWLNMSIDIPNIYIIANKCDSDTNDKINYDINIYLDKYLNKNIKYLGEVSAKNNIRIESIFKYIINDLKMNNIISNYDNENLINLSKNINENNSYCC